MSQGIQFNGILTRAGTRSDGSLGITLETPELTDEECLAVFNLRNVPCEITFRPNDSAAPPKEIKTELGRRTQSERTRAVLFLWWKSLGEPGTFDSLYVAETEKFINSIKLKLPQQ